VSGAQYRIDRHWSASVNINNVFDKTYYRTMGRSSNGNFYGEPRSAALILRASY
jgi:outer membrane receptor for ferric coprogen and ferric-rhodotorulic acid